MYVYSIIYNTIFFFLLLIYKGIVPKSKYGNIDLFKPYMLPEGAAYLNCKFIHAVIYIYIT